MDTITITPTRYLGPITALVTLEERGSDRTTITRHPVEKGANVTDHAYDEPAQVVIRYGATNSSADAAGDEGYVTDLYAQILALKATHQPFSIQTGKRLYQNMLIESVDLTTDEKTEAALALTIGCTQIFLVDTSVVTVPSSDVMASPEKTAATLNSGTKQATVATGVTFLSTAYLVPLSGAPETFGITLAGVAYTLTVQWRDAVMGGWFLDIADAQGVAILSGIPLVTGVDLLAQYSYLNLGGQLHVQTSPDTDAQPTFDTLGSDSKLYFITD